MWRLYVDIGNSAVKYGVRRHGQWVMLDYVDHMLGRDVPDDVLDDLEAEGIIAICAEDAVEVILRSLDDDRLKLAECSGIGVSSTTEAGEEVTKLLGKIVPCPVKRVGKELKPGLKTEYRKPSEIGADRWANVVAAVKLYGPPVVVIDAGTCLTSEVVNGAGVFVGGCIAAGLNPLSTAVALVSPRLAQAMFADLPDEPPPVGRSTAEAVQRGVLLQLAATADRFALEGLKALGVGRVVITGGHAEECLSWMQTEATHDPLLTLEGIRLMDHYE